MDTQAEPPEVLLDAGADRPVTRYMALREGILVVRRDMAFTSKACPKCGTYGERFSRRTQGRGPHPTFRCPSCEWEGNADPALALNLNKEVGSDVSSSWTAHGGGQESEESQNRARRTGG